MVFMPLSCIHWPHNTPGMLEKWVQEVKEDPDAYALLMGDSCDASRTHYRDYLKGYTADGNSQQAIDEWNKRDVRDLAAVLEPIKHKILGNILGNHHMVYLDQINSEQYLCQLLGIPYFGPTGVVRITLGKGTDKRTFVIYAHHTGGSKGGRTSGSDLTTLTRSEDSFEASIYALGHTHRCYAFKSDKLGVSLRGEPKVVAETKVFLRCGTLLKGYGDDNPSPTKPHVPSYAELAAYRPTTLGWIKCEVTLKRGHGPKDKELLYRVSY